MIQHTMPRLRRRAKLSGRSVVLDIPGGWTAHIPEVAVVEADRRVLAEHYSNTLGKPMHRALEWVSWAVQYVVVAAWTRWLREAAWRRAVQYAKRYPDTLHDVGTARHGAPLVRARGFKPESVQWLGAPHFNSGRAGSLQTDEIFATMYNAWRQP